MPHVNPLQDKYTLEQKQENIFFQCEDEMPSKSPGR